MPKRPAYLEIFATCLAAILLEIAYTRIFSFKVLYYFTYVVLGMGLLGIGAGGVALTISPRLRSANPDRLVSIAALTAGVSVVLGYLVISPLSLDVFGELWSPRELGKLVLVSVILVVPFFLVGIVISTLLSSRPEAASRLYGADLLGAAAGSTLAIPLLERLDPPRTVLLAGLILGASSLRLSTGRLRQVAIAAVLGLAASFAFGQRIADPVVSKIKLFEDFRAIKLVRFSKWSPVFRIDVTDHPFYPGQLYMVFHDGQPGSGLRRFDRTFREFEYLKKDQRALPFEVLPKGPRVLIIGSAGGHEVVASLFFGASHVTGVELNPVTVSLLTDHFAKETGRLTEHPRVKIINGDGRWFLKQTDERFDLIWFVAPDSYAAMNAASSGAFVLSESYLYTEEMLKESLRHLTPGGIISTHFGELDYGRKPNRTIRYLATARSALRAEGLPDFSQHVLVASADGFVPFLESSVLLGRKPFTPEQAIAFAALTPNIQGGVVRYFPGGPVDETPVNQVIALPDSRLPQWFRERPYQVDPVTDDRPFFWHFTRFRDAISAPVPTAIFDHEDSIAEQITLAFLGVVVLLAAGLLFLPFLVIRKEWREIPHKGHAAVYFAGLGLGFMFLEVTLMQKLTLLLGYPTRSLSVVLFSMLAASGVGSLLSGRLRIGRNRLMGFLLGALGALVLGYRFALPALIDAFIGSALFVRVALTVLVVAPLGLCLGAFMPAGLRTVASITEHRQTVVAWAWAVNGFFSVIASVLSTLLAMSLGFQALLLVALGIYAVAVWSITRLPEPGPATLDAP